MECSRKSMDLLNQSYSLTFLGKRPTRLKYIQQNMLGAATKIANEEKAEEEWEMRREGEEDTTIIQ